MGRTKISFALTTTTPPPAKTTTVTKKPRISNAEIRYDTNKVYIFLLVFVRYIHYIKLSIENKCRFEWNAKDNNCWLFMLC